MSASGFVLGIDFGGTKIDLATARRDGTILARTRIATDAPQGADRAVERAVEAGRVLLATTPGTLAGVGAVSPGIVGENGIRLAPNVPGWESLKLPALLREGFDTDQVAYANDVKAAGTAEARWGALRDADPAIFLSLGTGVGAALIIGGRVVLGAHGAAGEIGYNLRGVTDQSGAADGRAPLEESVGGAYLAREASRLFGDPMQEGDQEGDMEYGEGAGSGVGRLFASREAEAVRVVGAALDELAVHVANLAIALDPERIAVGGGLMASGDRILPALRHRIALAVPFPPEVVAAHFLRDSALHGAHALILDMLARGPG